MLRRSSSDSLLWPFEARWGYSQANYIVAVVPVNRATGKTRKLLVDRLLEPLFEVLEYRFTLYAEGDGRRPKLSCYLDGGAGESGV